MELRTKSEIERKRKYDRISLLYTRYITDSANQPSTPFRIIQAIADEVGMTYQGVRMVLIRLGLPVNAEQVGKEA